MKKCFLIISVLVFLLSCTEIERDNEYDEHCVGNACKRGSSSGVEAGEPSSSGKEEPSSSSSDEELSDSSADVSSSGEEELSSSSAETDDEPSSSSGNEEPSSSSAGVSSSVEMDDYSSSSSVAVSSSSAEPSSSSVEPSSSSEAKSSSSVVPSSSSVVPEPENMGESLSFTNPDYTEDGKKYYWLGTTPNVEKSWRIVNKNAANCEDDIIYELSPKTWDINSPGTISICAKAVCDDKVKTLECAEAEFVSNFSVSGTCEWAEMEESPVIAPEDIVPQIDISILNNYGRCEEDIYLSLDGANIWSLPSSWQAETANLPTGIKAYVKCNESLTGGIVCPDIRKKIKNPNSYDYIVDERDGQAYQIVEIGEQIWMAENLNFKESWMAENLTFNGKIYDWRTAMSYPLMCNSSSCSSQPGARYNGICPSGWHIPSSEEWGKLSRYVDGSTGTNAGYASTTAGKYLKATSGWGWSGDDNGTDQFGFSALPQDGVIYGSWWSRTEANDNNAYYRSLYYSNEYAEWNYKNKTGGSYVRCLKD